jgi:hypothetical protein
MFGDFQTPDALADEVVSYATRLAPAPAAILEPSCGSGALLRAALQRFPKARAWGIEIDGEHVARVRARLPAAHRTRATLLQEDFFAVAWPALLARLPDPLLIVANPPWVTNATLGTLGGSNLPVKRNDAGWSGVRAITGKSNFCISEWMITRMLEWLEGRRAALVVICKTSVARRVLEQAWRRDAMPGAASLHRIDARCHFGARVDACVLAVDATATERKLECGDHASLDARTPERRFGWRDRGLVADIAHYELYRHLRSSGTGPWRSGIKHDCARVMELEWRDGRLVNGLGESVEIEPDYLHPLLKSSDLARRRAPWRAMLVPQRHPGSDTAAIAGRAPKTWRYLCAHATLLDRRASRVYRGRPRFSIFGVGSYSFRPWKVAIAALHKSLDFHVVGPHRGDAVVLDDTTYFVPCSSRRQARQLTELLSSPLAQGFYSSLIFWDAKRPVTSETLGLLDLELAARELG